MKNSSYPSMIITISVFFFAAFIIIAQLFTPESYSWTQNTVSELAAQGYDNARIMQIGLIGYGLLLVVGLSTLFGLSEKGIIPLGKGILQRIMYFFGLTWILINYNYFRNRQDFKTDTKIVNNR